MLFDTGPPTEHAWQTLCREVDLARLKHLFVTHWHADHAGLAARVLEESKATLYLSELDAIRLAHSEQRLQLLSSELCGLGFDDEFQQRLYVQLKGLGLLSVDLERYQVLEESPVPQRLGIEYLKCAGHSQSDLIFLLQGCAISGDILLPEIFQTPLLEVDLQNLSGRFNNYAAYCESLLKFTWLQGYRLLPGHRHNVASLEETVRFYVDKVRERALLLRRLPTDLPVSRLVESLVGNLQKNPLVSYLKASELVFLHDYLQKPQMLENAVDRFDAGYSDRRIKAQVV